MFIYIIHITTVKGLGLSLRLVDESCRFYTWIPCGVFSQFASASNERIRLTVDRNPASEMVRADAVNLRAGTIRDGDTGSSTLTRGGELINRYAD